MTRVLFLDDQARRADVMRTKYPEMMWALTSAEAIRLLDSEPWDLVSLDYDLADGDCGMLVADWLAPRYPATLVVVHSTNLVGASRMMARLLLHHPLYVPFTFTPGGPFNL